MSHTTVSLVLVLELCRHVLHVLGVHECNARWYTLYTTNLM